MATIGQKRTRKCEYRKIWIEHYGPIPKDENGISFDIHHIDGNVENNDITNLIALSMKDHYETHLRQEEYFKASLVAKRMFIDADEWRDLKSKATKEQWAKLSKDERSLINKRGAQSLTPEQRSEKSRKGRETLKLQGKLENVGKNISKGLSNVDCVDRAKRGWETRKAKALLKS